ncbi:MAG: sigma-54 dependent transcriptional regulator [Crocinitomicaceae bacterium]|nr:sigma-54 dependent transcriptional regulator [Crocinitomicaceae bacterium]
MEVFRIIVAEDDKWYSDFLSYQLELIPEYEVEVVRSGKELKKALFSRPNLITLDYQLPDSDGLELLKFIKKESPDTEVLIISGQEELEVAVELFREGAYDYLMKDVDTKERLWNLVSKIKEQQQLKGKVEELQNEVNKKYKFEKFLVGNSPNFKGMFKLLEKAAGSSINVSITGETGTGKEVVAKSIHYNSAFSKKKFVAVNIAAIPEGLIESELFGHEKGAFTGASSLRIGKFEEANGGTLFIDEVGELDLNSQVKLLRVLQEREVQRVGGNKPIQINCRIICATHKDLTAEVEKGTFRQDLFYRLVGLPIKIPTLRDRKQDILVLAKHFIDEALPKKNMITISEEARKKMMNHSYPGNVRELKSVIELASVMCEGGEIKAHDITFMGGGSMSSILLENLTLKEMNKRIILQCLDEMNQNIPEVSKRLGIGKSSIYRLLKEIE